ncbi:PREDICTED: uncharacterized protein LOC104742084 isoform X2 [Camelina sativa]|uniref:Uncharacterized protein LOC104742084 isoform X2 n=1 Tax=Camelina sativa TaxID=90675 RepID=A0ABM1QVY9_CAMSA|nr:PREDICTED: uncharacterized protein LOC104742084 isoform X2 [Camelina sativa]
MDQAGEAAVLYRVFIGLRSTPVVKPIATLELFDPVAGRILRRLVWLCVGLDRRRTTRLLSFRNWISLRMIRLASMTDTEHVSTSPTKLFSC